MSFVSHVECTGCGQGHDAKRLLAVCERCGQMLAVRYDLERVARGVTKEALRARPPGMYRFRELTPLDDDEEPVTLGEGPPGSVIDRVETARSPASGGYGRFQITRP